MVGVIWRYDLRHNINGACLKTAKWTTKITHTYMPKLNETISIYTMHYNMGFSLK